jgi:hypothetical protein
VTSFLKIAEGIDVTPLRMSLARQPELFGRYGERQYAPGTPHSGMTDIWVRYNDRRPFEASGDFSGINDSHESVWYPDSAKLPEVMPIVHGLMAHVKGERLGGVLITKLPAGGSIEPHIDSGWHAATYDKFYVAVQTPPGSVFGFPDGKIIANDGDVYFFKNNIEHWVTNNGSYDRIAMIVCIQCHRGPAW